MTVRVRIPAWVGAVWDLTERRPYVTVTIACLAFAATGAPWTPLPLALASVGWFGFWAGMLLQQARVTEARSERDQLLTDNARKDSMIRTYERGQAIAPTRPFWAIGDRGERT